MPKHIGLGEDHLKYLLCDQYGRKGYDVYVNVVHNMMSGEDVVYGFKPDIDVMVIGDSHILGIEVKGFRRSKIPSLYEALGEAMLYLKNPVSLGIKIDSGLNKYKPLKGSIFDEVYIFYPDSKTLIESSKLDINEIIELLEITPIGLMTLKEGVLHYAKENPFMNQEAKDTFITYALSDKFKTLDKYRCNYYKLRLDRKSSY